jgi:hypothetical protein
MGKSSWRRIIGGAGLVILGLASMAGADGGERVRLQLKTYRQELRVVTRTEIPESGAAKSVDQSVTIETKVESVRGGGRMTLVQRVLSIKTTVEQGEGVVTFDSTDPEQLKQARANPDMADLVGVLSATFRYEQEPTGELRSVKDTPADPLFEQMVKQGVALLPAKPVKVLEPWDSGSVMRPASGLGSLVVASEAVLLHERVEDGERIAYIGIKGTGTLRPDEESGIVGTLKDFSEGTLVLLAEERGRLKYVQTDTVMTFGIVDKGRPFTLRVKGKTMLRELP